jgi:NRAMP (natural resistance-associated macrophage protein)-like metal ion transporter
VSTQAIDTMIHTERKRRGVWRTLALMGPAFVAGAWQFGPGNLTTAVQAGSSYQYTLIWVIAVSTLLMIFITDMSVRLGIKSPVSLITSIKEHLGGVVGVLAGVGVFLICLCFSVGNAVGSGLGLSMLIPGSSPVMWTVIVSVLVAALLMLRSVYKVIERVLIVIVALMAVCFIVSAFVANPDWAAAGSGLLPTAPDGSWLLIVALVGTNLSINAAFFTAYGTKERERTEADYRDITLVDTIPGIIAPGVMTALVIVVAASVLGQTGEGAESIAALAKIFEPLAGPIGGFIFALGFFGAAFSSMITNAMAGGTLLSDAFGKGASASTTVARIASAAILAWGVGITLVFQSSPVQLIVVAQALTVFIAPVLAIIIVVMANRRSLMHEMTNTWWQNLFGILGIVAVLALSIRLGFSLWA